jgi:diaminohydroxyphosphoribosylaminopyrimidine deaminase/5-amino-6-(5-phosphoribosylamino)uracil reductase
VEVGVLQDEAGWLIEAFACHVSSGLPLVISKVAMSLDGRIAAAETPGGRFSCEEGRAFSQDLRLQCDALLVGVGTVLADDPQLSYRGRLPKSRPLQTVVLDSFLRTPPESRLFQVDSRPHALIFCGPDAPEDRRHELESRGAEIVPVPHGPKGLDLHGVMKELGRRNVLGLLVEGGSKVHWSFTSARLIDKFFFMVTPIVLGGADAVPAVGGTGYATVDEAPRFRIKRSFNAGSDLVLEAYPVYSKSILSPWLSDPAR